MSRQTFTNWIFSWLSSFQDDFRTTCSVCKENPPVVACDGTKLGIYFKNSSVVPIEEPSSKTTVKSVHRRTERQFFHYKTSESPSTKQEKRLAREDLSYFVAKRTFSLQEWESANVIAKLKSGKIKKRSESDRIVCLLKNTPAPCQSVMQQFISETGFSPDVNKCLAQVLRVFSTESPVSSLVNYRFVDDLLHISEQIRSSGECTVPQLLQVELPEIYALLKSAKKSNCLTSVNRLIDYIANFVKEVHSDDPEYDCHTGDREDVGDYDPESTGKAYYFTATGCPVRKLPQYECNEKKESDDDESKCRKSYVEVAKCGTTYLFLWFDPIHYGHCYGYHIIPASEGRKDPFASAFLHMEKPPEEVFYDFSCQLEEYCLNREPKFWRSCRFWHDIFHGYSHKCPYVYMSKRIPALRKANTEICEQFNSYIQKIKYSSRSMSQSHFTFYLQFFIHRWNLMKREKFNAECEMAKTLQE